MTTQTNAPNISGIAGAAIVAYRMVKMDTATQTYVHCTATAADVPVGVAQNGAATGEQVTIRLLTAGTFKGVVSSSCLKGAKLYTDAAGKLADVASTGRHVGYAMEAGSGDNSVVECISSGASGASFDQVDLAAATAGTALTVSTGGSASTTLAAGTNTTALTDNGAGTADNIVAAQDAFAASVSWNGSSVFPSAADASLITAIALATRNNMKEVTTQLALQRTLNTVLLDSMTSMGTEYNKLRADFADLRAKGVTAGLWLT